MPNSHKGNFGHALLIAGKKGKMGAAIIAAKACLRSGTGLLTINVPEKERLILQVTIPEAMLVFREKIETDLSHYSTIGIGPGIGNNKKSFQLVQEILVNFKKPILLDADALNCLALNKYPLDEIPKETVLTPHPKEFDRLFGKHKTIEDRINTAIAISKKYELIIVLKGHKTIITDGIQIFQNSTGNAGLAKGGSGDCLTGIITSFLAQGYAPIDAAKISVYLHGFAADIAVKSQSMESMLITDVIDCMGKAFKAVMK